MKGMEEHTLTLEQRQALDELIAHLPKSSSPGFLQTWLGISQGDLKAGVQGLLDRKIALEKAALDWVNKNPLDAAVQFISAASLAFFVAEKDVNPKIRTYIDAFYYISTCASVGYADIFAATQTGRAVAALVMLVGPAITNKALDKPA